MMIKENRSIDLKLAHMDVAIIIREDGTLEASLPEIHTAQVPENVFTSAALVYALNDPKMCQLIYQNFAQECARNSSSVSTSYQLN